MSKTTKPDDDVSVTLTLGEFAKAAREIGGATPSVTHEFLAELKRLTTDADSAKASWERTKERASALKKVWEEKLEDLLDFIRRSDGTGCSRLVLLRRATTTL